MLVPVASNALLRIHAARRFTLSRKGFETCRTNTNTSASGNIECIAKMDRRFRIVSIVIRCTATQSYNSLI